MGNSASDQAMKEQIITVACLIIVFLLYSSFGETMMDKFVFAMAGKTADTSSRPGKDKSAMSAATNEPASHSPEHTPSTRSSGSQDEAERRPAAEQFNETYDTLMLADKARDQENLADAVILYRHALDSYMKLAQKYPDWQPGTTRFRITYCKNQFEALLKKMEEKSQQNITTEQESQQNVMMKEESRQNAGMAGQDIQPDIGQDIEPAHLEVIKSTAKLLLKEGETAEARQVLMKGLHLEPDDKTIRLLMGMLHCQANEFENAMYMLEPLVEEDPSNANARVVLGTAYFGLGRIPDAKAEMKCAVNLNPRLSEAHYNLTQILLSTTPPDLDGARYHYKKALDLGSKPDKDLNFLLK